MRKTGCRRRREKPEVTRGVNRSGDASTNRRSDRPCFVVVAGLLRVRDAPSDTPGTPCLRWRTAPPESRRIRQTRPGTCVVSNSTSNESPGCRSFSKSIWPLKSSASEIASCTRSPVGVDGGNERWMLAVDPAADRHDARFLFVAQHLGVELLRSRAIAVDDAEKAVGVDLVFELSQQPVDRTGRVGTGARRADGAGRTPRASIRSPPAPTARAARAGARSVSSVACLGTTASMVWVSSGRTISARARRGGGALSR